MNTQDKVIAAALVVSLVLLGAYALITGVNPLIYGMVV